MEIAAEGLSPLLLRDDWLPDQYAQPSNEGYRQYLLYCDPMERFCVVSFVWGLGQATPIHDHTVWGVIGVLRGAEHSQRFAHGDEQTLIPVDDPTVLKTGQIERVSPAIGDIHQVANASDTGPSVSIHVYGGNIGRISRHVYDENTGAVRTFISRYSNDTLPNLWA
jgi:predicted metal-dependent enzyme (double-stranded beta helix superfamily)